MPIAIIGSLIAFQILFIFVHLTVYAVAASAFGIGGFWIETAFVILALTFTTATFLVHYSDSKMAQGYYKFASYWFGLINFLFIGAVAFFIAFNILNYFDAYLDPALIAGICFAASFLVHLYGTWNSGRARVVRVTMPIAGLPEYWRSHKMVFVSDVHLGAIRGASFSRKIVEKINAIDPALILVGGDVYDGVKCEAEKLVAPFKALKPLHGTYYITGNHEYYGEFERYMNAIRGVNMKILKNELVTIEGLRIAGVSYQEVHKRVDFQNVLRTMGFTSGESGESGATPKTPTILLKHEPDNMDIAEAAGFAGGFFGHTHAGQIYPLMYITARMYGGLDYGLKQFKNMSVYTSSGVGTWGPPLRVGTKSEIIVVSFAEGKK